MFAVSLGGYSLAATASLTCSRYPTTDFQKEGDEIVRFSLQHASFKKGLRLVLMFPDLAGYPVSHQCICYSENDSVPQELQNVMEEVAT